MYASARKNKWFILIITVLAPFMATLDASVVNIAQPVMARCLHVDSGTIAWVANAYTVTLTATILFFGRLGDLKGQTRVFEFGTLIFTIGSILCSLSSTFPILIGARIFQALGASATMANSQGIIVRTFPANERGKALGINGAFVALGLVVGPSVGGFIISCAGWPYMFWINIPFGIFIMIAGMAAFQKEKGKEGRLDLFGTVLFAATMASFFYALQEGQIKGFSNPVILVCFAVAVVCFVIFLIRQRRTEQPLLDLKIFQNRQFSVSILCAFISFAAIGCFTLIAPFYLEDARSLSPAMAGLYMTSYSLMFIIISVLSGTLSDKVGAEGLTVIGLILLGVGAVLTSVLKVDTPFAAIALSFALMGIGNGFFQSPNNRLVMSSVPKDKYGIGGSVNGLMRYIGQAAGIAVSNVLLYGGMSAKLNRHITNYIPGHTDAFLFGMKLSCTVAAAICFIGGIITVIRLYSARRKVTE